MLVCFGHNVRLQLSNGSVRMGENVGTDDQSSATRMATLERFISLPCRQLRHEITTPSLGTVNKVVVISPPLILQPISRMYFRIFRNLDYGSKSFVDERRTCSENLDIFCRCDSEPGLSISSAEWFSRTTHTSSSPIRIVPHFQHIFAMKLYLRNMVLEPMALPRFAQVCI